ncbi:jerky protein homolog-like [Anastrepha ludens]|uniref:jerky protein homolog-like n=1 Tax=Anastrepha ludens TaxID=28586 RepID=UPI0023B1767E|nr:jerky protein homolog-like [Anastrepha ludens]
MIFHFKTSSGWLYGWQNRHGVKKVSIQGEKICSIGANEIEKCTKNFKIFVENHGFTSEQVFNADETGLNYKALPKKTLDFCVNSYAPGWKVQKQRITLMVSANSSGYRLPLVVVHTAKRPRCDTKSNMNALPVAYYAQKNAWMDQTIFRDWFMNSFVPNVRNYLMSEGLSQKAVLVLDNVPSHPVEGFKTDDGNIFCYFLPPSSTAVLQPMDQSVIETLKHRYWKKFIQDLVSQENIDLADYWKNYNIKNAIDNVADSWSELSSTTLEKCWNKLWPNTESPSNNSDDVSRADVATSTSSALPLENSETINEWLNCDENDCGYELLTDEQIINKVNDEEENNDDYDGTDNNNENGHNPTASFLRQEAKIAASNLEKCIA